MPVLLSIRQRVDNNTTSFYSRNQYEPTIIINSWVVPKSYIHGNISSVRENNATASLNFTLLFPAGVQTPENLQGSPIYLYIKKGGVDYRVFTGYIDVPVIDLIEKKITFQCTDRRENQINTTYWDTTIMSGPGGSGPNYNDAIKNIGYYSETVFGKAKDRADELNKRLSTIPYDFNFDLDGKPTLTAWLPKTNADFSLTGSDVYYDKPEVRYTNRSSTLNKVSISIKYLYQRLHQQYATVSWQGYQSLTEWARDGNGAFPGRELVANAANAAEWIVKGLSYTSLWPAQGITVNGISTIWQPDRRVEYKRPVYVFGGYARDEAGNIIINSKGERQVINTPATYVDQNGVNQPLMEVYKVDIFDASSHLCRSANWKAYRKFSQNVVETYSMDIIAPSTLAKYGEVISTESYNLESSYNTNDWESGKSVWNIDYNAYFDVHTTLQDLNNVLDTARNKAKTAILKAHRDCTVSFRHSIWPQIDLRHTVEINSDRLDCKGRVNRIEHSINASTGEGWTKIDLLLSRPSGVDTPTSFTRPSRIVDNASYIGESTHISLGTYLGKNPAEYLPVSKTWNGFIGNKTITNTSQGNYTTIRTNFTEEFRVDYPAIPDNLLLTRELSSDTEYSIAIPDDDLEITF